MHGGESECNYKKLIKQHLADNGELKIITTYDSLPRVCESLSSLGYDTYGNAHLVIDEWHLLLMSYGFRKGAIRGLLDEAKKFKSVTYISATPIEKDF